MANTVLFINSFLSYLLLFAVIVVLVIAGCLIGINLRKRKDAQEAAVSAASGDTAVAKKS